MLIHEGDLKWIKVYEHKLFNISGGKEGEEAVEMNMTIQEPRYFKEI